MLDPTDNNRSKASYIRRKIRQGKPVSQAERDWLDAYAPPGSGRVSLIDAVKETVGLPTSEETNASAPPPIAPVEAPKVPSGEVPFSFSGSASDGANAGVHEPSAPGVSSVPPNASDSASPPNSGKHGPSCPGGATCPGCAAVNSGGYICATTGTVYFPPMSEASAKILAASLLMAIAVLISFFRKDRSIIQPTPTEKENMAKGLKMIQERRPWANWIGAYDDVFVFFGALGAYGIRAAMAPSLKPLQPTIIETPRPAQPPANA